VLKKKHMSGKGDGTPVTLNWFSLTTSIPPLGAITGGANIPAGVVTTACPSVVITGGGLVGASVCAGWTVGGLVGASVCAGWTVGGLVGASVWAGCAVVGLVGASV